MHIEYNLNAKAYNDKKILPSKFECFSLKFIDFKPYTADTRTAQELKKEWGLEEKVKCLVNNAAANNLQVRHAVCMARALKLGSL